MKTHSNIVFAKPLISALNDCEKPLVDLFFICGFPKSKLRNGNMNIAPQILDSYPTAIKQTNLKLINLVYSPI